MYPVGISVFLTARKDHAGFVVSCTCVPNGITLRSAVCLYLHPNATGDVRVPSQLQVYVKLLVELSASVNEVKLPAICKSQCATESNEAEWAVVAHISASSGRQPLSCENNICLDDIKFVNTKSIMGQTCISCLRLVGCKL